MTEDWYTTPDGREALSRAHGTQGVVVIRLSSGKFAIYNDIKQLQGIVESLEEWPPPCWKPRVRQERPETRLLTEDDLRELGFL